ncbi:MAG: hypothetical protein L0H83_15035, partial [Salinisphaera sp.]|nr:hypothetical protein [Salinisphaera sp.]
ALPTRGDGAYLVRLRITSPEFGFDEPVLRYFVNPALAPSPAPQIMTALGPAAGDAYGEGMGFSWEPLPGAAVYRLEFYERPPTPSDPDPVGDPAAPAADPAEPELYPTAIPDTAPISGIVISAELVNSQLSPLVLDHLPPGRTYWWRVVAFDSRGDLVGRSPLRPLLVPPEPVVPDNGD